jgi:WhiB family redox-sensing transcriptional regulator
MARNFDPPSARDMPPVAALPDRACNGADVRIFYPTTNSSNAAKAVCRTCPHIDPCLDWALATRQGFGVWAATTPEERAEMLKTLEDS